VCVRRVIQCTCVAHDARSHSHNRVRGHIHPCIRACRYTKYKHACMPIYQIQARVHADIPNASTRACLARIPTYLHSSAQRNSTYHAQSCPSTTHSCEQAMCCTYCSVWSVELCASAAAMCCAPSAPMELCSRLCVLDERYCVAHDARSGTHSRVRGHMHPRAHIRQHTKYKHACMPLTRQQASVAHNTPQSDRHTRSCTLTEGRRSAAAHEGILLQCVPLCAPPTAV
jgi:hypothetical protein